MTTDAQAEQTDPLAEPRERVGRGWTASLSLANGAIWVGWYGPLQILLALQAEDFAPGTGMSKETLLAWVTGSRRGGLAGRQPVLRRALGPYDRPLGPPYAMDRGRDGGRGALAAAPRRSRMGYGRWCSAGAWSSSP